MPGLVDTHCHLDAEHETTMRRARAAGLAWVLDVGIDLETSRAAAARAATVPDVEFAAGLHPCSADRFEAEFEGIRELCAQTSCRAVGETGMDLYWDRVPQQVQETSLRAHLALARELDKPVILHCRDAFTELLPVLAEHPGQAGVFHCFSDGPDEAEQALALGYYLSFAGPLTYPRNDALRAAARLAPADRILVETDAPFLPPQGHRGETNEPAHVIQVAAELAALRGVAVAELHALLGDNAGRLFGLPGAGRPVVE